MSGLNSRVHIFTHFWIPIAPGGESFDHRCWLKCLWNWTAVLELQEGEYGLNYISERVRYGG